MNTPVLFTTSHKDHETHTDCTPLECYDRYLELYPMVPGAPPLTPAEWHRTVLEWFAYKHREARSMGEEG